MRNKTSFPPVVDCPDENELDLRYYSDYGGSPTRHWCLLAEVVEYTFLGRLVCEVRDIQGKDSRVAFYDDERGIQFVEGSGSKTKCKIGYTVAVLYPSGHGFLDMSYGFRVEEQSIVRVSVPCTAWTHISMISHVWHQFFPCTLKQLYSANEMIRSPSVPMKTCSALGCDKVENLQACSACHAVQYCGKVQTILRNIIIQCLLSN